MPGPSEIIDVDKLSSSDSEIEFTGFKRDASKSKVHQDQLDTEGLVYIGFNETPKPGWKKHAPPPRQPSSDSSKTPDPETIPSSSTSGPPAKRQKRTHQPYTTNPTLKRDHAQMRAGSRSAAPPPSAEVICISDSEEEKPPKKRRPSVASKGPVPGPSTMPKQEPKENATVPMDVDDEEDYAAALAALDLNNCRNWIPVDVNDDSIYDVHDNVSDVASDDELDDDMAQSTKRRVLDSILKQQQQSFSANWARSSGSLSGPHLFHVCRQARRAPVLPGSRARFSPWTSLHPTLSICRAPKDINAIIQGNGMIVMASAVADGRFDNTPGPYNRDGTLVVWSEGREYVLDGHCRDTLTESGQPCKHYLTVNDVAFDPSCPTHFASAGRDRVVMFWDCEGIRRGEPPILTEQVECEDNPEVIKYDPGGSTLAIQCDNGAVYLYKDGAVREVAVAPQGRGHVTAEMSWGIGPTRNMLFASSAKLDSEHASGHHRAYDVTRSRFAATFDAGSEACSTLTLDPSGERLFIATENPQSTYTLWQFDVRRRERKPSQKVGLEPFVDVADGGVTDVNSLSLSLDGLYIAVGRTDNWADVYDSRMLARGPLHTFAHEGDVGPHTFGIVKTQWVDDAPCGVGLVTGGIDGCVRLWDVKRASKDPLNGAVLAECDYDVSTFTLGDAYRGDKPIIVGEQSGKVTVFDRVPRT